VFLLAWNSVNAASVVFLNPGKTGEAFWDSYISFMQGAADDLGMHLRVLTSERDRDLMLEQARTLLQGADRPDYLMFVNEQYAGPEILRLAKDTGVKLFAVNNTLTVDQQRLIGNSRETYPYWIGSVVADDEDAGYLLASELIQRAREKAFNQPLQILAFTGDKQTPASQLREKGLRRALAENPDVRLCLMVVSNWDRYRAYEQARTLLPRYRGINMVWAANDQMAFGAMQAAEELGIKLGQDMLFGASNSSAESLQARVDGRLSVLLSGNFTLGGWAMVMLNDFDKGVDFASHGGKDRKLPLFMSLSAEQAATLAKRQDANGQMDVDFRRYSLKNQAKLREYSFSLRPLLD
jgi:ABC-type sugar transport system substrate-binding protein